MNKQDFTIKNSKIQSQHVKIDMQYMDLQGQQQAPQQQPLQQQINVQNAQYMQRADVNQMLPLTTPIIRDGQVNSKNIQQYIEQQREFEKQKLNNLKDYESIVMYLRDPNLGNYATAYLRPGFCTKMAQCLTNGNLRYLFCFIATDFNLNMNIENAKEKMYLQIIGFEYLLLMLMEQKFVQEYRKNILHLHDNFISYGVPLVALFDTDFKFKYSFRHENIYKDFESLVQQTKKASNDDEESAFQVINGGSTENLREMMREYGLSPERQQDCLELFKKDVRLAFKEYLRPPMIPSKIEFLENLRRDGGKLVKKFCDQEFSKMYGDGTYEGPYWSFIFNCQLSFEAIEPYGFLRIVKTEGDFQALLEKMIQGGKQSLESSISKAKCRYYTHSVIGKVSLAAFVIPLLVLTLIYELSASDAREENVELFSPYFTYSIVVSMFCFFSSWCVSDSPIVPAFRPHFLELSEKHMTKSNYKGNDASLFYIAETQLVKKQAAKLKGEERDMFRELAILNIVDGIDGDNKIVESIKKDIQYGRFSDEVQKVFKLEERLAGKYYELQRRNILGVSIADDLLNEGQKNKERKNKGHFPSIDWKERQEIQGGNMPPL